MAWTMGAINPGTQWNEAQEIERLPLGERHTSGGPLSPHRSTRGIFRDNPPLSPTSKSSTSRNAQLKLQLAMKQPPQSQQQPQPQPNASLPPAEAYAFDPSYDSVLAKISSLPLDEWRRQQAVIKQRPVEEWLAERERLARRRARQARPPGRLEWCLTCCVDGVGDDEDEGAERRARGPSACAVIACTCIVLWSLFGVCMALSVGHVLGGVIAFLPVFVGAPLCCGCCTCWARDYKASLQGKHECEGNEGLVLTLLCVWCCCALVVAAGIVASMTFGHPPP